MRFSDYAVCVVIADFMISAMVAGSLLGVFICIAWYAAYELFRKQEQKYDPQ